MSLDDSGAGGYRIATETLNVDEADLVKAANVIGSATAINTITVAAAGSGAHRITGGSAADLLSGGAGVDTINGMAGNDTTVAMVVREHGILAQAFPSPGPEQHGRRSTGTLSRLRTARPKSAVWCECRRPILAASFTVPEREACSFSLCSI
jgi:Ca2+-binding RTX toxin-like protein